MGRGIRPAHTSSEDRGELPGPRSPGSGAGLPWWLRFLRRETRPVARPEPSPVPPTAPEFDPEPPLVILACPQCGPEYTVTKVDAGEGRVGGLWTCSCGHRYIPAGGELSERFVRP